MFERFTREAKEALTRASSAARELRHDAIGTEHILLGLEGTDAAETLASLGAPMTDLRPAVVQAAGPGEGKVTGSPPFTAQAKKALELSLREALARNDTEIRPEHLLLGLLREGSGLACLVLTGAGVTHEAVSDALGPAPVRSARRWRRPTFLGGPDPSFGTTPGGASVPRTARRLAGDEPVSTLHYLRALLGEGVAGRILESLGVTPEAVAAASEAVAAAGTSDEMPSVSIEVEDEKFRVTPEQAEQIRRWLRREGPPPLPPDA